jgi:ketosteroid isomerase-like protein
MPKAAKKILLTLLLAFLFGCTPVDGQQTMRREILALLTNQAEAWNRGDIEGYMQGYWNSDSTLFSSGGNLIRGFNAVLERYRKRYATRAAMGRLEFDDVEINPRSPTSAVVVGVWRLERKNDRPWGRFTLLVEKKTDGWKITVDHTSSAE